MGKKCLFASMAVVFGACGVFDVRGKEDNREKMVTDMIKRNGSLFRTYGCHCGADGLGSGEPKDYIDACCQILNCCYEVLRRSGCDARATDYAYVYDGDNVECRMANDSLWCESSVCECDLRYSTCLLDSHGLFNPDFVPSGPRDCPENAPSPCNVRGSPS